MAWRNTDIDGADNTGNGSIADEIYPEQTARIYLSYLLATSANAAKGGIIIDCMWQYSELFFTFRYRFNRCEGEP